MYDNRKYNVYSFIGHSVVLQYVTFHRVEQIWNAKTCLNANLMQWHHEYANDCDITYRHKSRKILWETLAYKYTPAT